MVRVLWSPDESRLLTFSADDTATLWDSTNGHAQAELANVGPDALAAFSQQGARIAVQEGLDRVTIAGSTTGARLFAVSTKALTAMAFSPDGRSLLLVESPAGRDMTLRSVALAGDPSRPSRDN